MALTPDFRSLQERLQASLVSTTKSVNKLADEDLQFHCTVNPSVSEQLEQKNNRLLQLSNKLLSAAGRATEQRVPFIDEPDDVDISFKRVVDIIDTLLERADTSLDEYTGLLKRKDGPTSDSVSTAGISNGTTSHASNTYQNRQYKKPKSSLDTSLKRANIPKPQAFFERSADNLSADLWKPLLTTKPHALVSLEESLTTFINEEQNIQ